MNEQIPVLSMRRVGRTHGSGVRRVDALVDVDLDVMPGEMVAITGRSGSGKSTMLNLAGGLDQPTTGSVHVDRANLGDLSATQLHDGWLRVAIFRLCHGNRHVRVSTRRVALGDGCPREPDLTCPRQ